MAARFGVTIDCRHPSVLASFWCRVLGYVEEPPPTGYQSWAAYDLAHGISAEVAESGCTIIDPEGASPRIYFQRVPEPKRGKNRVHLDIPASPGHSWDEVVAAANRAVAAGGRILRESTSDDDRFIVMTDPEDNEFCLVL